VHGVWRGDIDGIDTWIGGKGIDAGMAGDAAETGGEGVGLLLAPGIDSGR